LGKVKEFIEKLNRETGKGYRLLSEAEWEYAAKAGTTTDTYVGDLEILGERNAPILDTIGYYIGNSGVQYPGRDCSGWRERQYEYQDPDASVLKRISICGTHPVGSKQANAFGLYDMVGNVWEYTQDCYHENYDGAPVDGSAWVKPAEGAIWSSVDGVETDICSEAKRVLRGGSWRNKAWNMRSSFRETFHSAKPKTREDTFGFRLAISASEL
jgi:formylglycine-generating enzyme required for sulfatase activity